MTSIKWKVYRLGKLSEQYIACDDEQRARDIARRFYKVNKELCVQANEARLSRLADRTAEQPSDAQGDGS